jgi:N-acetyltransferase
VAAEDHKATGVIRLPDPILQMVRTGFHPPVTLEGRFVRLVPLVEGHGPGLARAGRDPAVWEFLRIGPGRNEAEMAALIGELLALQRVGSVLPFTIVALPDGRPVGIFRYLYIDRENRSVETGTWLDSAVWRTPINTEVKYLGLRFAFEEENVHRVQLKTDRRNERSQRAIERLGAVREGVHREHYRLRDGTYRTSVSYSILEAEWPWVKQRLEARLARPWPPKAASGSAPPPAPP